MILILYVFSSFIVNFAIALKNKTFFKLSRCDYCHKSIGPYNIPIIMGLFKTRCCNKSLIHYSIKESFVFLTSLWLIQIGIIYTIVFYLLYIISDYDILTYEITYSIFFILCIILIIYFPIYHIQYFIITLLVICSLLNKIGFGDVVFIAVTSCFVSDIGLYLFISCIIGIIWVKKEEKIPFLPSLSISFMLCLLIQNFF